MNIMSLFMGILMVVILLVMMHHIISIFRALNDPLYSDSTPRESHGTSLLSKMWRTGKGAEEWEARREGEYDYEDDDDYIDIDDFEYEDEGPMPTPFSDDEEEEDADPFEDVLFDVDEDEDSVGRSAGGAI